MPATMLLWFALRVPEEPPQYYYLLYAVCYAVLLPYEPPHGGGAFAPYWRLLLPAMPYAAFLRAGCWFKISLLPYSFCNINSIVVFSPVPPVVDSWFHSLVTQPTATHCDSDIAVLVPRVPCCLLTTTLLGILKTCLYSRACAALFWLQVAC
jgi:hypothetical protein